MVGRYIRELVTGWFGILADASTILWIVSYFLPAMADARGVFFFAMAVTFVASGYRVFVRQESRLAEAQREHASLTEASNAAHQAEVARLMEEIGRLRGGFADDTFHLAEDHYTGLNAAYKEAIHYLLIAGDATDRQTDAQLRRLGYGSGYTNVLATVSHDTPFVQRAQPGPQKGEHVSGYTGLWTVNPTFRAALQKLVAADPDLQRRRGEP